MFYCRLKEGILLRGWFDMPFAISNQVTGETFSLSKSQFDLLNMCDGKTDLENKKSELEILLKKNIIEICKFGQKISTEQRFKFYNCRYVKGVRWSITGKCNFLCKHCYVSAPSKRFEELPLSVCLDFVDQFANCGIRNVNLTGGEPLVRKDFLQIIDKLIDRNICVKSISTNGSLLTEKLLMELKSRNIRPTFAISFDGVGYHDIFRGFSGAEKKVIDAVKLLNKHNFPVAINMVVNNDNIYCINKTIDLFSVFDIDEFKVGTVIPSGEWRTQKNNKLDIVKIYDAYLDVISHFINNNSPVNLHIVGFFCCVKNSRNFMIPSAKGNGDKSAQERFLCKHSKNVVYLSAEGKIKPCISFYGMDIKGEQRVELSLMEMDLCDILSESEQKKDVGKKLSYLLEVNEECRKCKYKFMCCGGCRAKAAALTGNYYGCDRYMCTFFKENYTQKIENVIKKFAL